MKFIGFKCEFNGKINEIHILIDEKWNREIPGFFKISRDTSRTKIKPGSWELNPDIGQYFMGHNILLHKHIFNIYSLIV